jgi:hypothetical protein
MLFVLIVIRQSNQRYRNKMENRVSWTQAEWALKTAKADLLGLFDCCQAGELNRTRGSHLFEYLGANSEGMQFTEPPGEKSFTTALIWALEQLWNSDGNPFTTAILQQKIKDFPQFPKHQIPCLVSREGGYEHISLRPQRQDPNPVSCVDAKLSKLSKMSMNVVDIRLHFRDKLEEDKFVDMAKALSHALYVSNVKIPADRVEFLGMRFSMSMGDIAMKMTQKISLMGFCYRWLRLCKIPIKSPSKSVAEWRRIHMEEAAALATPVPAMLEDTTMPNSSQSPLAHTSAAEPQSNATFADDRLHAPSYADRSSATSITMHDDRSGGPAVPALGKSQAEIDHKRARTSRTSMVPWFAKRFSLRRWWEGNSSRRRRVTT